MSIVAIIPARFASTRLPAKALAADTGKYLVQHVYEQVRQAGRIDRVVVATDDLRIVQAVESFDGQPVMTRPDHVSGTDRVGEAAQILGLKDNDIVINVQGDEAEICPDSLDRLVQRMLALSGDGGPINKLPNHQIAKSDNSQPPLIGTLAAPFDDAGPREGPGSPADPNRVKVVVDEAGRAMYFSRSLIPFPRDTRGLVDRPSRWLLHMGVYAFRMSALRQVTGGLSPTDLERAELLEQLRWMHHGLPIDVVVVNESSVGIDTPEDYAAFVRRYRETQERSRQPVV